MIMEIRRAVRWRFIGILLDGSRVELPGVPFISSNEDEIRAESVRRASLFRIENAENLYKQKKLF